MNLGLERIPQTELIEVARASGIIEVRRSNLSLKDPETNFSLPGGVAAAGADKLLGIIVDRIEADPTLDPEATIYLVAETHGTGVPHGIEWDRLPNMAGDPGSGRLDPELEPYRNLLTHYNSPLTWHLAERHGQGSCGATGGMSKNGEDLQAQNIQAFRDKYLGSDGRTKNGHKVEIIPVKTVTGLYKGDEDGHHPLIALGNYDLEWSGIRHIVEDPNNMTYQYGRLYPTGEIHTVESFEENVLGKARPQDRIGSVICVDARALEMEKPDSVDKLGLFQMHEYMRSQMSWWRKVSSSESAPWMVRAGWAHCEASLGVLNVSEPGRCQDTEVVKLAKSLHNIDSLIYMSQPYHGRMVPEWLHRLSTNPFGGQLHESRMLFMNIPREAFDDPELAAQILPVVKQLVSNLNREFHQNPGTDPTLNIYKIDGRPVIVEPNEAIFEGRGLQLIAAREIVETLQGEGVQEAYQFDPADYLFNPNPRIVKDNRHWRPLLSAAYAV